MSKEGKGGKHSRLAGFFLMLAYPMALVGALCLAAFLIFVLLEVPGAFPRGIGGKCADATLLSSNINKRNPGEKGSVSRAAIIIDDLGSDMDVAARILRMDVPVTVAVLPYRKYSREIAARAFKKGRDVLLHLPLQPRDYPMVDPGPGCLLVSMDRLGIQRELHDQMASVPHCVGVLPHMGSLFSERRMQMMWVVAALKENGFFLADSISSPDSVVPDVAKAYGVPLVQRTHLVDESRNEAAIVRELCRLADFAAANGWALGVAHPYPETLAALPKAARAFREKKVELVPLSRLLLPGSSGQGKEDDFVENGSGREDNGTGRSGPLKDRGKPDGVS